MPVKRRRALAKRRVLSELELVRFDMWPELFGDEASQRAIYAEERERLLTQGNEAPLHVEPFWRFEAGIPDELRERPPRPDPRHVLRAAVDGEETAAYEAAVAADEELMAARRRWLATWLARR